MIDFITVHFSYNSHFFLKNLNFSVKDGEFLGIIGPNGAGKSTLLRLMDRILQPDSGQININGRSLEHYTRKELARIIDGLAGLEAEEGNLAEATLKPLNMPQVINLRQDPFERFPRESNMYFRWYADKMWTLQKEMRKLCGKEVFMSFGQASLPLSG